MRPMHERLGKAMLCVCAVLLFNTLLHQTADAAGTNTVTNSLGMEFVLIPPGTYEMGSPANEPYRNVSEDQHLVTISRPFYLQTTEVTLNQWWTIMGKKFFGRRKGDVDAPITRVSWFDAVKFIEKLNEKGEGRYRLPTEAEWEYACRAGTKTAYSWGNDIDCSKAMYANNTMREHEEGCVEYVKSRGFKTDQPAPVKSYAPNAWGLYDMHGNVWEWCLDWFEKYYPKGEVTDPRGPKSSEKGRIRRGGSWFGKGFICRSANRAYANPASRFETTGFRLVREAQ